MKPEADQPSAQGCSPAFAEDPAHAAPIPSELSGDRKLAATQRLNEHARKESIKQLQALGIEVTENLRGELRKSTQQEIVAFDQRFALKTQALYTWELWGVAYLLLGGCSDDEFTDVRT